MRTERVSPRWLITTPVATRRVPGGASGAVYSRATTDSRAFAIAAAIRRSSRSRAANNAMSSSVPLEPAREHALFGDRRPRMVHSRLCPPFVPEIFLAPRADPDRAQTNVSIETARCKVSRGGLGECGSVRRRVRTRYQCGPNRGQSRAEGKNGGHERGRCPRPLARRSNDSDRSIHLKKDIM